MRAIIILMVIAVASGMLDSTFEDVDFKQYFMNETNFQTTMKCLLNKGPCDENLDRLKYYLPTIGRTGCEICSPENTQIYYEILRYLEKNHPRALWALSEEYLQP